MFLKLSFKNVRKSFKNYAVYFLTLIFGVAIFYIFNSLADQEIMSALLEEGTNNLKAIVVDFMGQALFFLGIFVAIVLGFLVIYANRFLMKRRGKEFAIYLTLGMSKRKISQILSLENFLIGILSLIFGIILGVILAQGASFFILQLFEADLSQFAFQISWSAIFKTCVYFLVIFVIVAIFSIFSIRRAKLIDLLNLKAKREKNWLKKTWLVAIIFVLAILILFFAYRIALEILAPGNLSSKEELLQSIARATILGAIGTVLFFLSFANIILKIVSLNKNFYYKKLRIFVARKFSQTISTMVASLSVISIMLFATICLLSSAFSIKNFSDAKVKDSLRYDVQIEENSAAKPGEIKKFAKYFSDSAQIAKFHTTDFMLRDLLGEKSAEVAKKYSFWYQETLVPIVSLSDYNKFAKLANYEQINLKNNQFSLSANYEFVVPIYQELLESGAQIKIAGENLTPANSVQETGMDLMGGKNNDGILIVPDSVVAKLSGITLTEQRLLIGNLPGETRREKLANFEKLDKVLSQDVEKYGEKFYPRFSAVNKYQAIDGMTGLGVIAVVIALYLGLVFLLSSVAILAIKSLSDALDSRENYQIIRQIGASEKMINRTIFFETAILFLLPLVLALVHAGIGLKFCVEFLKMIGLNGDFAGAMIGTASVLVVIYASYILLTYFYARRIMSEKNFAPRN